MATLTKEQVERIDSKNGKIYKYYKDDRQPNEVLLATQLTRALSELNFQSLNSKHISTSTRKAVKREDILYVCLPGVPPFPNEFQNLNLPGQVILFEFISFQKGYSEEELMTMQTELDTQAKILHQRINQASTTKPIVFVYHSFGTYALASYWSLFKNDRIIGLIDLGGAPIRFYEAIKEILRSQDGYTIDFIQENIDMVYHFFTERNKKFGVSAYEKKSQVLGMCKAFKSKQFEDMFVKVRNLPKVLKCFVYGRKDLIFPETFISEKMVYYCYENKFEPQYQLQLQKAYERFYARKCQNVQERFIFSIQGGHHSIHMQRKYKQMMGVISSYFLSFLEQVHAVQPSKL